VSPPVANEDIPPEDEGWLCPLCDARVDVIYVLNDEYDQNLGQKCVAADVFKAEAEMQAKGIVPGTSQFEFADEEAWPSDESADEDFDKTEWSDDGRDDENEALSGSARSASDESSSEEEELIVEGPRRRTKVDYVKLNGEMFGGEEAYEGEFEDSKSRKVKNWKSSNKSKAEMLAAIRGGQNRMSDVSKDEKKTTPADIEHTNDSERIRHRFDKNVIAELERIFSDGSTMPQLAQRHSIAASLGLDAEQVRIWFQNRRRRLKRV